MNRQPDPHSNRSMSAPTANMPTPRVQALPPLPTVLFASMALAIGTHVAVVAIGFLQASWTAAAGGLTSVFFAPFCLLAMLVPFGTGTLTRRWFPMPVADQTPTATVVLFCCLLLAAELLLAGLHALGAPTSDPAMLPHVVLGVYALRAAITLSRRSDHAHTPTATDAAS